MILETPQLICVLFAFLTYIKDSLVTCKIFIKVKILL